MMARVMISQRCIHRHTGDTKVYAFSHDNFLLEVAREIAKWENDKGDKTIQKSSRAKVTFKNCKTADIEEFDIHDSHSYISELEAYVKWLHECGKKSIRVDWTLVYEPVKDAMRAVVDISSDEDDEESSPLPKRKNPRMVIFRLSLTNS